MGTCGTTEHLPACGLKSIKQQLKYKRLVASFHDQGAQGNQLQLHVQLEIVQDDGMCIVAFSVAGSCYHR